MISFNDAYRIVMESAGRMPVEHVPLLESLGRITSEDTCSDLEMPAFDKSAMDGFACREADIDKPLRVIETIPAGIMPGKSIGQGECARIMTGAVVPPGADTVIMFEHTSEENGQVIVEQVSGNPNIRHKGEDIRIGDRLLAAGSLIGPVELAVLAGAGQDPVPVSVAPRVAVVATGDELVEPSVEPFGALIRNTNSSQLCGQVERIHCRPLYQGIAKDTPNAVEEILDRAFEQADVVLFSGGVSEGDFDYVPDVLKRRGVEIKFSKVNVKPGKPTVFGMKDGKYFFGLPGNPVSTFVLFEVLVRPFLYRLMGHEYRPFRLNVKLNSPLKRRIADRMEFRPVRVDENGGADPSEYHGSAHIHAYTRANAVIAVPPGVEVLEAGEIAEAMLII